MTRFLKMGFLATALCIDKEGQVWECEDTGYWRYNDGGSFEQHTFVMSHKPIDCSDKYCTFHATAIVLTVNKSSGKILLCMQSEHDETITPVADNVCIMKVIQRNFDWQGNPTTTQASVSTYARTRQTVQSNPVAGSDHAPLLPRFVEYLKGNGMSDRIPPIPSK
jgi:hypothetical protein